MPRDLAALAFMKRALKRHEKAAAIVTGGLHSYPAAMCELGNLERPYGNCLWSELGSFRIALRPLETNSHPTDGTATFPLLSWALFLVFPVAEQARESRRG